MEVEELRRELNDAGRQHEVDLVEARAAVGTRAARRRRRQHWLAGLTVIALLAVIAVPVALLEHDGGTKVRVAPQPFAGEGWTVISKVAAGLGTGSSFGALASNGHSLVLGGALARDGKAAIWYSDDGVAWKQAQVPGTANGVDAIATAGDAALAVGSNDGGLFVWRSDDGGSNWKVVASGGGLFGPTAPEMGRPFVSGLVRANGMWIASGGGSDGYAAVWISSDGAHWQQALDSNRGTLTSLVGSVSVVDNGDGQLLAYSVSTVWSSGDGSRWGEPAVAAVPSPYSLGTVAPGGNLAFGEDIDLYGQKTPLLRRADARQEWFVDPTFLMQFPGASVGSVTRVRDLWVATGTSGSPNHPDAWVSSDGTAWRSLASSLSGAPGGTLSLAGAVDNRIVLIGAAPELDRYYTLNTAVITDQLTRDAAHDASDRYQCTYGIEEADFSADGLPNVTTAATDRATANRALEASRTQLLADNPKVSAISVGPGFRRAWQGENGGPYEIVYVRDYAILLHLRSADDCPRGKGLETQFPGVPIFYTVG